MNNTDKQEDNMNITKVILKNGEEYSMGTEPTGTFDGTYFRSYDNVYVFHKDDVESFEKV